MRADRLLSLMMLLQQHGQLTAAQLADRLAVSIRTIYRDVDALCQSGVPIYANGGPGGGYALLDSYRTNLTGLNEAEVRAFFMLAIPGSLAELGMGQTMQAALLKMRAALPTPLQTQAVRAQQRFHVDARAWFTKGKAAPFLNEIQQALWEEHELILHTAKGDRRVKPLALVSKANHWYLVCDSVEDRRVFRVSRLSGATQAESSFERPANFDLRTFWAGWVADFEASLKRVNVTLNLREASLPWLLAVLPEGALSTQPVTRGWQQRHFWLEDDLEARSRLLGLGTHIEVVAPQSLRRWVQSQIEAMSTLYGRT